MFSWFWYKLRDTQVSLLLRWFLGFYRSVNEVICHGIPDMRPLEDGDIMNGRVQWDNPCKELFFQLRENFQLTVNLFDYNLSEIECICLSKQRLEIARIWKIL